jgi:hypothetical protein
MTKAIVIGSTMTVVLTINGQQEVYTNSKLTPEQRNDVYLKVINLDEEDEKAVEEIRRLMVPEALKKEEDMKKELLQKEKMATVKKGKAILIEGIDKNKLFEVDKKTGDVYLKGYPIPMPELLIHAILRLQKLHNQRITDSGITLDSIINFWKRALLNPNPEAREDLFKYVNANGLTITPRGMLVTYRQVVKRHSIENSLSEYIAKMVDYVKHRQKKSIKSFWVVETSGVRSLVHVDKIKEAMKRTKLIAKIGKLDELYDKISELDDAEYTDAHTRSFKIKIGVPVSIKRKDCDSDASRDCSNGLHVGTPEFVNTGGFGDTRIVAIIDPMHVVSVPYSNAHKMRVCEYFPAAIIFGDKIEADKIANYDYEYASIQEAELENMLKGANLKTAVKEQVVTADLDPAIVKSLIKDMIKKRVVKVK